MLFNSYEFIFLFLPSSLLLFYLLGSQVNIRVAITSLVLCSWFFYGWWNYHYLVLLLFSIGFNFLLGRHLVVRTANRKPLLLLGIFVNLALIGYFKYANFFVDNMRAIFQFDVTLNEIILPLAISFFTFQQITFLVDSYRGQSREYDFLRYCLFVSFFPQLIAGPIVHHGEMIPQFQRPGLARLRYSNLCIGLSIFAIGLFKKAVLADGIAPFGNTMFAQAESGAQLQFFQAWGGALCYTFQLYFDFSGYSDMAIGLGRMFGIKLPLNFDSPYKAPSIIDFWRRWHMTLSRFLRDYVYIPLGGSRSGPARRHVNVMMTMLLGGLWHGAGWTFVVWGGLHGLYLVVNHVWRALGLSCGRHLGQIITFIAVVVGWVFFRSTSFDGALVMLEGMAGLNGVSLPMAIANRFGPLENILGGFGIVFHPGGGAVFLQTWSWVVCLLLIAIVLPNTQEIMSRYRPAFGFRGRRSPITWRLTPAWALTSAVLLAGGILALPQVSEFLYFQF